MIFCNFCDCDDCKYGTKYLTHAKTSDGKWICDVCYTYDLCTADGPNRNWSGPCENKNCQHRPTLISDWIKSEPESSCKDCGTNLLPTHCACVICSNFDGQDVVG